MIATQVVTHTVKRTINRERPNGGDYSFPSGHTSCAFQAASFLQFKYGWQVGIPAYALAAYVGWSRYYADKHYISDILAGAAVGIFMSYICLEKDVRIFTSSKKIEDQDSYALNFQLSF
jgi:membrane-associated phospholipid phosphatase